MAQALITLTANQYPGGIENTQHLITMRGTVTVTASPATYAAGGLGNVSGTQAINWQQVGNGGIASSGSAYENGLKVQGIYDNPIQVTFFSVGNNAASGVASLVGGGYKYVWNKANGTFQILAASGGTAGTGPVTEELTAGTAIPSAVSNDTILFEAVFVRSYS